MAQQATIETQKAQILNYKAKEKKASEEHSAWVKHDHERDAEIEIKEQRWQEKILALEEHVQRAEEKEQRRKDKVSLSTLRAFSRSHRFIRPRRRNPTLGHSKPSSGRSWRIARQKSSNRLKRLKGSRQRFGRRTRSSLLKRYGHQPLLVRPQKAEAAPTGVEGAQTAGEADGCSASFGHGGNR